MLIVNSSHTQLGCMFRETVSSSSCLLQSLSLERGASQTHSRHLVNISKHDGHQSLFCTLPGDLLCDVSGTQADRQRGHTLPTPGLGGVSATFQVY